MTATLEYFALITDKAFEHPMHGGRRTVSKGERIEDPESENLTSGVKKYRCGARSAAGSMTALSPARSAREHRFQMRHYLLQARGPA